MTVVGFKVKTCWSKVFDCFDWVSWIGLLNCVPVETVVNIKHIYMRERFHETIGHGIVGLFSSSQLQEDHNGIWSKTQLHSFFLSSFYFIFGNPNLPSRFSPSAEPSVFAPVKLIMICMFPLLGWMFWRDFSLPWRICSVLSCEFPGLFFFVSVCIHLFIFLKQWNSPRIWPLLNRSSNGSFFGQRKNKINTICFILWVFTWILQ